MLQSADDDTGRYPLLSGETLDVMATVRAESNETLPGRLGYQEPRRPTVRFGLNFIHVVFTPVNEHILLAMKKDMRGFMEQTEPEVVVRFVARTQRDDRLAG